MKGDFVDTSILTRFLVPVGLVLTVLYFSIKAISEGNYLIIAALVALPFLVLLLKHNQWIFIAPIALYYSWLYIPGMPASANLFNVAVLIAIPYMIIRRSMKTEMVYRLSMPISFLVCLYLAVIIVTISFRGIGMRILGSSEGWGGAKYAHVLMIIAFFLLSNTVTLSVKQWRRTFALYCLAGLIPSIAEMVFIASSGTFPYLYSFIRADGTAAAASLESLFSEGVTRLQVSKYVSLLFLMGLGLWPFKGKYCSRIIALGAIAFIFAGLSGHRSTTIYLLAFIPAVIFMFKRKLPVGILSGYVAAFMILMVIMRFLGIYLPLTIQRSFSWVPLSIIEPAAKLSAEGTFQWRLDVWGRLVEMIPQYWIVGRGFTYDPGSLSAYSAIASDSVMWAIETHNYHNGPLSLLIDLGLAGLIAGSLLIIGIVKRHIRLSGKQWNNPHMARIHKVLIASFCVDAVRFFLIHGGASSSFVAFILQLTILEGLYRSDQAISTDKEPKEPATLPVPPKLTELPFNLK